MYHQRQRARVVLFGMRCGFTAPVLEALSAAPAVDLRAVVLPERVETIPTSKSGPVLDSVSRGDLTFISVVDRSKLASPEFRTSLEAMTPDAIVVACFPWRLPAWLLALPGHGCLNVHPSLLPDGRGPEPVFWAFRWGLTETGVTVHLMDAGFDSGPVLAQQGVAIGEGATIASLELTLAKIGAELLNDCLLAVLDGSVVPTVQAGEPARHARMPRPGDLVVPTTWTAHDAARFIRAVVTAYGPVPVLVPGTGQRLAVTEVIGVDDGELPEQVSVQGAKVRIRFSAGVLVCRLAAHSHPLKLRRAS